MKQFEKESESKSGSPSDLETMKANPAAPVDGLTDEELQKRLDRAKWRAGGLLVAMAIIFLLFQIFFEGNYPFRSFFEDNAQQPSLVGLILAFTGAAMIGGLADWFAVVALFRHPMGIPIPRTAIIPERKDTIGKELANFVRDQVLKPEEIKKQLEKSDMTRFAGDWLQKDSNARDVSKAIDWCLDVGSTGNSELRGDFKRMLVGVAQNIPVNEAIATTMHVFATGKNTQPIIGQLTQFGLNQIDHNRERIREKIKEKTRWLLFSEDSNELRGVLQGMLVGIAQRIPVNEAIAAAMDVLTTGKNAQPVLDQLTQFGLDQVDRNRERIREKVEEKTQWLLFSTDSSEIRDALRGVLTGVAKNIPINEALAAIMKVLATGKNTQFIIDELVKFGRKWIGENKKSIRESIESAWWRPDFIDDMMCDKIISDILRILSEIEDDKNHRARTEVREFFSSWGDKLTRDRSMAKNLDGMRDEFFRNKAVRSFFQELWDTTCKSMNADLKNDSSDIGKIVKSINEKIHISIISEIEGMLKEINTNQDHPVRIEINNLLSSWSIRLKEDSAAINRCEELRNEFFQNDSVQNFFQNLFDDFRKRMHDDLRNEGSDIGKALAFADEKIYTSIVLEIEGILQAIGDDQNHPIRVELNNSLLSWSDKLRKDKEVAKICQDIRDEFIDNQSVQDFFSDIWDNACKVVFSELRCHSSGIRQSIEREIYRIGEKMSGNVKTREYVESFLRESITTVVWKFRKEISSVISKTIEDWPKDKTAKRVELHVGEELQFIRMNGTIVGGLVGVVIYLLFGFLH